MTRPSDTIPFKRLTMTSSNRETATLSLNSFKARNALTTAGKAYTIYDLKAAEAHGLSGISQLPVSLKILLENLLRHEDGVNVTANDILGVAGWLGDRGRAEREISFTPGRVLMHDTTGLPAVVDLASMRDAYRALGGDPRRINPVKQADLVIDHSVMVDRFGSDDAFAANVEKEYGRNGERYRFLRWGSQAFENLRVVPPGTGILHQINMEYLARVIATDGDLAFPDTLAGTDSHTTMINGLSVLAWGVGGIEAEAVMLGQPIPMLLPEVVGMRFRGKLPERATATDLVLTVTQILRAHGVTGKFVEFFGEGLAHITLEDQATIANMAPEYGATCGYFPFSAQTLRYLHDTGRDGAHIALVEAYARHQGLWHDPANEPVFTDVIDLDLSAIVPSLAGPKRPQDRVSLSEAHVPYAREGQGLTNGAVVIAAITSCTNTSNPAVMIAAGLLARKARARGLKPKPWVKTSLAPGSKVTTDYLVRTGLQDDLDALGFNLVGYGCMTCIGNSGPLAEGVSADVQAADLNVAAVLSGNRNFEGRIHPDVKANYLASPPLCVAYALAGSMAIDLTRDALGHDADGRPVYLRELWPSSEEIAALQRNALIGVEALRRYDDVFTGDDRWRAVPVAGGDTFAWEAASTYVARAPYFDDVAPVPAPVTDIVGARIIGLFGDSITTDHISPAGSIRPNAPAGLYLRHHGVEPGDFNSYGSRRGHHEVLRRGAFANARLRNQLAPEQEGGVTRYLPSGEVQAVFDAAERYRADGTPLIVIGGRDYGTGSSRDWAAKGTKLLGVRAVIAQSFERIHRSNLIGMGVLPLQFTGEAPELTGNEVLTLRGLAGLEPRAVLSLDLGDGRRVDVRARIDTRRELDYYRNGGVLPFVLRNLLREDVKTAAE